MLKDDDRKLKKQIFSKLNETKSTYLYYCLKKFIESKNNLLMNEAILTQKICADALKKARYQ